MMNKRYFLMVLIAIITCVELFATSPLILDYESYANSTIVSGTKTGRTKAYKNTDGSTYAVISAGYDGVNFPSPYFATDNVCMEMLIQTLPTTDSGQANIQMNGQKVEPSTGVKTTTEREFGRFMIGKNYIRSQKPDPNNLGANINDVDFATGLTPSTWYKFKISIDIKNQKLQGTVSSLDGTVIATSALKGFINNTSDKNGVVQMWNYSSLTINVGATQNFYFDNLIVYEVVESSAVAYDLRVSGADAAVKTTVTAVSKYFSATQRPQTSISYQWYSGTKADGTDKAAITGATQSTYTLAKTDRLKYIFAGVKVSDGVNTAGDKIVYTPAYGPIIGHVPVAQIFDFSTSIPTFTGTAPTISTGTRNFGTFTAAAQLANLPTAYFPLSISFDAKSGGTGTSAIRLTGAEALATNDYEPTDASATAPIFNLSFTNGVLSANGSPVVTDFGTDVWHSIRLRFSKGAARTAELFVDDISKGQIAFDAAFTPAFAGGITAFAVDATSSASMSLSDFSIVECTGFAPELKNLVVNGTTNRYVGDWLEGTYRYFDYDFSPESGSVYQWYSDTDPLGKNRAAISGATALKYRLQTSDIDRYLFLGVTPKSSEAPTTGKEYISAVYGPVVAYIPYTQQLSIGSAGLINGNAIAGTQLTGDYIFANVDAHTESGSTYKWVVGNFAKSSSADQLISSGNVGLPHAIPSVTVLPEYVGKYVKLVIVPKDNGGDVGIENVSNAIFVAAPLMVSPATYMQQGRDITLLGVVPGETTVSVTAENYYSDKLKFRLTVNVVKDGVTLDSNAETITIGSKKTGSAHATITVPTPAYNCQLTISMWNSVTGEMTTETQQLGTREETSALYQYFLPDSYFASTNGITNGRFVGTFLWIPPTAKKIKGILTGIRNMGETTMMENPRIREVCAKYDIAVMMLQAQGTNSNNSIDQKLSFQDNAVEGGLHFFYDKADNAATWDNILKQLANLTGHPEIENTNFIPTGHSARIDWSWELPYYYRSKGQDRILCSLPLKSGMASRNLPYKLYDLNNVPIIFFQGGLGNELSETWNGPQIILNSLSGGITGAVSYRRAAPWEDQIGVLWDWGGHMDFIDEQMDILAKFIDASCAKRLPADADSWSGNAPMKLNDFPRNAGVLADKNMNLQTGYPDPLPYDQYIAAYKSKYSNNEVTCRTDALWYPNMEIAQLCVKRMRDAYTKTPQAINYVIGGTMYNQQAGHYGFAQLPRTELAGGVFKLKGAYYAENPYLYPGTTGTPQRMVQLVDGSIPTTLTNGGKAIRFQNTRGPIIQTSDSTFRLKATRNDCSFTGSIDFYLAATVPNSDTHMYSVRVIKCSTGNGGYFNDNALFPQARTQTITFPGIANINSKTKSIELKATASSGLPVEYFVVYGPAIVNGSTLTITHLPAVTKYPIEVKVAAYSLGNCTTVATGYLATNPTFVSFYIYE